MPIYRVLVGYEICVKAESKMDAQHEAERNVRGEIPDELWAEEIDEAGDVPIGWRDSVPYGEYQNRTTTELLN